MARAVVGRVEGGIWSSQRWDESRFEILFDSSEIDWGSPVSAELVELAGKKSC